MVIVVDSKYNPDLQVELNPTTLIGSGVSIGKFLPNTSHGVNTYTDLAYTDKLQRVRNLVPQVEIINSVNGRLNKFPMHRLAVVEGIYFNGENENVDGYNLLKENGQAVVYALYGKDGKIDPSATFDLAVYWKDFYEYDEVALSYDTINPDGTLNVNIIVSIPSIDNTYDVSFSKNINTYFNNSLAFGDELVEITL